MNQDEIALVMLELLGPDGAASQQGAFFARASAAPATSVVAWRDQLLADRPDHERTSQTSLLLEAVGNVWLGQLAEGQLDIQLLLPDDGSTLGQRIDALAQWCQGYLYGLALGGIKDFDKLPGDVPEFVKDALAISKAGGESGSHDDDEQSDEEEADYAELVEYVRVGAQLVFDELANLTPAPTIQ